MQKRYLMTRYPPVPDLDAEQWRILHAAARDQLMVNEQGRYVIGDEKKRPEAKARARLHELSFITWPWRDTGLLKVTLWGIQALAALQHQQEQEQAAGANPPQASN